MEGGKTSKQLRRENKIRKMEALLQITELNARDRMNATASSLQQNSSPDEPDRKKLKLDNGTAHSDDMQHAETELVGSKRRYSGDQLVQLRALLKESYKQFKQRPTSLTLKEPGLAAKLDVPASQRVPLYFSDIQSLVLSSLLKNGTPLIPRWCKLEKVSRLNSVRILFIEGAGISDYLLAKEKLPALDDSSYPFCLEVVMPSAYCGNLVEEFLAVPVSHLEYQRLVKTHGSLNEALQKANSGVFKTLRAHFSVEDKSEAPADSNVDLTAPKRHQSKREDNSLNETEPSDSIETKPVPLEKQESSCIKSLDNIRPLELHPSDKFPRTSLLLSAWQMVEEGYPILINKEMREKYHDYVFSKEQYKEVSNLSPMYGLDCEMCITCVGASEVTRVGIVNEKHETVLDTLVLPYNRITNFVTKYSGITAKMMENVTTRLEDVHEFIRKYLEPDAILVGQSLQFDLKALKIMHPYCIDTSVIFNLTGDRYRKSKLALLSDRFLGETIQSSKQLGHSPVEDSLASLKLVQLKLSQSIEFGDEVLKCQAKKMAVTWDTVAGDTVTGDPDKKRKDTWKNLSNCATCLFGLTSRTGINATLVSTPDILEKYIDYLDPTATTYDDECGSVKADLHEETSKVSSEAGRVSCLIGESNKSVIEKAATSASSSFFNVSHIQLSPDESNSLSLQEDEILNKINDYVNQMQEFDPVNSLSIVVLCGREKSSNGLCFMKLPKPKPIQKVNYYPNQQNPDTIDIVSNQIV